MLDFDRGLLLDFINNVSYFSTRCVNVDRINFSLQESPTIADNPHDASASAVQ